MGTIHSELLQDAFFGFAEIEAKKTGKRNLFCFNNPCIDSVHASCNEKVMQLHQKMI